VSSSPNDGGPDGLPEEGAVDPPFFVLLFFPFFAPGVAPLPSLPAAAAFLGV
jgi:hypothetical protein